MINTEPLRPSVFCAIWARKTFIQSAVLEVGNILTWKKPFLKAKPSRRKFLETKKLRVAHIITQLELGGAQRNTLYTLAHLDRERFESTLLCGTGGILDEEAQKGPWPTFTIPDLVR